MSDTGVFPSLSGLGWSVTKTPTFQTRIQRAISGRELRALDYPYPLWQFTLTFEILRDENDMRAAPQLGAGYNELRTLMGFFMLCQGAFGTFLFTDPTDSFVSAQILPPAVSIVSIAPGIPMPGNNYAVGDTVGPIGGTISAIGGAVASWQVASIGGGGAIATLSPISYGSYAVIPGTTNVHTSTSGSGSGALLNLSWTTATQLVRTLGDPSIPGGGFTEPMVAPNVVSSLTYNGVTQIGYSVNPANGIVTLPLPFSSTQPVIQATFSYYFRCRFIDDSYQFSNFMFQLWELKKLTFISVRP